MAHQRGQLFANVPLCPPDARPLARQCSAAAKAAPLDTLILVVVDTVAEVGILITV